MKTEPMDEDLPLIDAINEALDRLTPPELTAVGLLTYAMRIPACTYERYKANGKAIQELTGRPIFNEFNTFCHLVDVRLLTLRKAYKAGKRIRPTR